MNSINSKIVLSTRSLSAAQKKFIQEAGIELIEMDAIAVEFVDFKWPKNVKIAIFSSKNAVNAIKMSNYASYLGEIETCFCVGKTTEALLEGFGQKVAKTYNYSSEIAENVEIFDKNEPFHFFCGNMRRNEIPNAFKKSNVPLIEIITYHTLPNPIEIQKQIDAILFYSPSGVKSLASQNELEHHTAICLGKSTASEAKKHCKNVYTADATSVESILEKAVKILKND